MVYQLTCFASKDCNGAVEPFGLFRPRDARVGYSDDEFSGWADD